MFWSCESLFVCLLKWYEQILSFFPQKNGSQIRYFIQTQVDLMLRLLMPLNSIGFCYATYNGNVQRSTIQRTCEDLTKVYLYQILELKTRLAF